MSNIALLGAGRMANVHAASIIEAGAKVVVIYDPVTEAARRLAEQTGARVAASAQAAINDPAVDAVMIATSSDTHVPLLREAVKADKPALCEKPLAPGYAEAHQFIKEIGDAAARRIFLGFNRRFDRGHASLREGVHSGCIGRLEQLTIISRDPAPPPPDYVVRSGGLFRDMMIHDFDLARFVLAGAGRDPIVSVTAHGASIIDPDIGKLGDIDSASVTLLTEQGVIITILNSRRCVYGYDQRVEAFGTQGMLLSDNPRQSGLVSFDGEHPGTRAPLLGFFMGRYGAAYTAEIRAFLEASHVGTDMPVNAIDGLMALYLAEAADASLKQGKTIHLTGLEQEF